MKAKPRQHRHPHHKSQRLDFPAINARALSALPALLCRWLPDGRLHGKEWVALNPTRKDEHAGSFCINVTSGRWSDFATGDKGGDVISLTAYLNGITQIEAAKLLAKMLGE